MSATALAEEGAFVFSRMAGYWTEPTPERPPADACERRVVADYSPTASRCRMPASNGLHPAEADPLQTFN